MDQPVIGLCTALERARWSVWDQEAFLLPRSYVDAVQRSRRGGRDAAARRTRDRRSRQRAGPDRRPDPGRRRRHRPRRVRLRARTPRRSAPVPERDTFEIAPARRAFERDMPLLGICRGMQLMNVARGGTLLQHLPESHGHHEHRRNPGSFDGADHDVRLQDGSLAALAAGEDQPRHEVPPPPGRRPPRRGAGGHRLVDARRAARGDRGAGQPVRAGRAVASGGRRDEPADRLALVAEAARARRAQSGSARIASISTCAPLGSAATPNATRAGGSLSKNVP